MHRPTLEGERGRRTLFTNLGATIGKAQAYRMVDEAATGQKFVRLVISPDPKTEDTRRDLELRALTVSTITVLQRRLKEQVSFIAAVHEDHTDIRHVHVIALVNRPLYGRDFKALIRAATYEARAERSLLDRARGVEIAKHKSRGRVVLTAKRRVQRQYGMSGGITKWAWQTPVCPKAGMRPHAVVTIKPGLAWCRTCKEGIKERAIKLEQTYDGLELKLK